MVLRRSGGGGGGDLMIVYAVIVREQYSHRCKPGRGKTNVADQADHSTITNSLGNRTSAPCAYIIAVFLAIRHLVRTGTFCSVSSGWNPSVGAVKEVKANEQVVIQGAHSKHSITCIQHLEYAKPGA